VFVILCYCVCNYCVVYCIVLCIVVPLPPGTYPLAVNNNNQGQAQHLECSVLGFVIAVIACLLVQR
jgi:hypothetical protein